MRRTLAVLCLLPLVPLAHGQDPAPDALLLSELLPDPESGREFVELHNPTGAAVDLEGWRVEDAAGNGHVFGPTTLPAGGRIVVWSGGEGDALGPAMASSSIWNNAGDAATLRDPSGAVVDALAYGTADVPAPPKGTSLHRDSAGGWIEGPPSPGAGSGGQAAAASATVQDVPPDAAFAAVPERLRPGEAGVVRVAVSDPNGGDASWSLHHGDALLGQGVAGVHDLAVSFPDAGTVVLVLAATDPAGNAAEATATFEVADDALRLVLPDGGVRFPPLVPGGGPADATPFRLANDGTAATTPRIDVSDLRGSGTLPVAGRLQVGVRPADDPGAQWTWTPYDAPLAALPALAPGAAVEVLLRLADVPTPLPAGDYRTSFTVVP